MLVAVHFEQGDHVAVFHGRQDAIVFVLRFAVVDVFLVDGHVAGLHQRGAVGAQHVAAGGVRFAVLGLLAGQHVDGHGVEQRVRHLRGDRALPDERVQLELVRIDLAFELRRQDGRGRGANGLVRFLRIARLGLVDARLFGHGFLAVFLRDDFAHLAHRVDRQAQRVGTHVGDETDGAFAEIDTFI